jgi:hypothetical protein
MRFMAMGVASGATEATGGGDDLHGLGDAVAAAIGPTDGGKDAPSPARTVRLPDVPHPRIL